MANSWLVRGRQVSVVSILACLCAGNALADDREGLAVRDRTIGFVMVEKFIAQYQTPGGKTECPTGFNDGPREQFKQLFPVDGPKRTVLESQLAREGEIWFPVRGNDPFPFKEAQGATAIGLNLDGKVGPEDFVGPDGEQGIDNQLYRVLGCIENYRGPTGTFYEVTNKRIQQRGYNRMLLELTNVDSLVNDEDVDVSLYHGLGQLQNDASGVDFAPGQTQRVDGRWGKEFVRHTKGKIVDGVLITAPVDAVFPEKSAHPTTGPVNLIRDWTARLKLNADGAEGLMAGFADVFSWYRADNQNWSTHHHSYGQASQQSMYESLARNADAYPDPKTGENTAISAAWKVRWTQAFLMHPRKEPGSPNIANLPSAPAGRSR